MNRYLNCRRAGRWPGLVFGAIAAIFAAAMPTVAATTAPAIAFIEEDYTAALAAARARRVPLIVDLWAPWCHACRLMDAEVYTNAQLAEPGKKFVWLRLNTDRAVNEAFTAKHRVDGVPGLLAIDPADESKLLLRLGTATAPQVIAQLADIEAAFARKEPTALATADRDYAEERFVQAAAGYRAALSTTTLSAATRARAFEALTLSHMMAKSPQDCAAAAGEAVKRLPATEAIVGQIASLGLNCALEAPPDAGPWRADAIASLEPVLRSHVKQSVVLFDNRQIPYNVLITAREQAGDKAGAERTRKEWIETVSQLARNGSSAQIRAATASLLKWAAPKAEDCAQIVPLLTQLEAESPDDYMPPNMLASCHAANQRPQAALDALKRSLARARDGSEVVAMLRRRARLEQESGDSAAARQSLQRAITLAQTPGLEPFGWTIEGLQEELKKL